MDATVPPKCIVLRRAKVMGNVKSKVRVQSVTASAKLLEDSRNEAYLDQVSFNTMPYKCHPIAFFHSETLIKL